jgi:hypothetical protein
MKSTLQQYFQGWELQVDRGVRFVGVLVAVLAIAMLAISPAAGALVDDTRAPQQQTTLPDGNTTTAPESSVTTSSTATTNSERVSSGNSTDSGNNNSPVVRFQFPNQTTNGTRIEVAAPRLPNGGFLVVHSSSFPNNGLGSTIGVSEYIAPNSSYRRVAIQLFDVPGRTFDQQRLRSSTTLYVRAALDTNDNRQYDHIATGGAQDVGYVVDGRQAVLSAEVKANRTEISGSPASRYGIDLDSGSNRSVNSRGPQSQSEDGFTSDNGSGNSSTEGSSSFLDLGGGMNPVGGESIDSNVSGSNSSSASVFDSLSQLAGSYGPVLILISAGAIWMYVRHRD